MRVITGTAKGTKLNTINNPSTRPTLDRVKEPLFSIIQNYIEDANVLDLFAGSGALGIECISRGANKCIFCDKSHEAIKIIKQNIQKTRLENKSKLINDDYKKCLQLVEKEKFNIIFIDPPYRLNIAVDSIKIILQKNLLAENGIIILETDDEERDLNEIKNIERLEVKDVRKYGRVKLMFLHERG